MRPFLVICPALALTVLAACASIRSPEPTAAGVLSKISEEGGHKVLWDLWEDEARFSPVLSGIESGDAAWLQVAIKLLPFADGSASLSLHYSVARALPKQPERILTLVGHGFNLDRICTSPFIEPDPGIAEAYERETLAALAAVAPALAPIAAECSKQVRLP